MSYQYMDETFTCSECGKKFDAMQESHYVGICEGCAYEIDHPKKKTRKKAEPREHNEQVAFFQWCDEQKNVFPELAYFYAVPNGGYRHPKVAGEMKAEGAKAGVPDMVLPCARQGYHGLYIENKVKGGKVSENQKVWIDHLTREGYLAVVSWDWNDAKEIALSYLGYTV